MKSEQISVFLENRAGRLAEVTVALSKAGINIRALSLADTSDFGILRMIVSDSQGAKTVLKQHGFTLGVTSVVAVAVDDQPGGLSGILELMQKNNINVEYMYAFVNKYGDSATMIFRFDKIDDAIEVLGKNGIKMLPQEFIIGK